MPRSLSRRQCLPLLAAGLLPAADSPVTEQWRRIASEIDGTVGAAALHLGTGKSVSLNAAERFPLASVCKLPIAAHIFAMVEEGRLKLDEEIAIPKNEVWPGVSVVAERWAKQHRFKLDQLLEWMVAKSDNTVVLTLWRIGGGAPTMAARLRQWKVEGIRLDRSERECGRAAAADMTAFLADPRDTATPDGTVQLLRKLYAGELLSAKSTARLIEILNSTTTGPARIKGLLPAGTIVGHKTGTTATAAGVNGSTNDVGVIELPGNAGRLAIAVYIKGSTRDQSAREQIIARIAKAAYDGWTNPSEPRA